MDDSQPNFCRAWPSAGKLGIVLALLVTVGLLSSEQWPAICVLGAIAYMGHALAGTPTRVLWRRGRQFAGVAFLLGIAGWGSRPGGDAAVAVAALTLRMLVAFLCGLWLMQVLTAAELLHTLRRFRCPGALIAILSFLLRYVVVLWDEHGRLLRAQAARAGGPTPGWPAWTAAVQRVGLLILRAFDRAERAHRAMLSRGWDGTERWLN